MLRLVRGHGFVKCNAAFRDYVEDCCLKALVAEGFERFRKHDADKQIHDGFYCWTGLNNGLYPDRVEINPFVGVHVMPLMRFYTKLEGRKYNRASATWAVHMGELPEAQNETAFAFGPGQSEGFIQKECARLARLYATAGWDYAKSIASYEALLPLFKSRIERLGGYPERYASALYFMGRRQEARAFTEEFLQRKREYFEAFAIPFLKLLDEEKEKQDTELR